MDEVSEDYDVVSLIDDDGVEREFALMAVFELEGGTYAMLGPVEQIESEDPELDLFAFAYSEDEEGIDLEPIEDDDLLQKVFVEAGRLLFGEELADVMGDEDEDEDEE